MAPNEKVSDRSQPPMTLDLSLGDRLAPVRCTAGFGDGPKPQNVKSLWVRILPQSNTETSSGGV
jgi:hypothetical protein